MFVRLTVGLHIALMMYVPSVEILGLASQNALKLLHFHSFIAYLMTSHRVTSSSPKTFMRKLWICLEVVIEYQPKILKVLSGLSKHAT